MSFGSSTNRKEPDVTVNRKYARDALVSDYYGSSLTIKQIAEKHGVCVRTVYKTVEGKANRKGHRKADRRMIRLNKDETELLLLCILECESIFNGSDKLTLLHAIEDRLLDIADELT